METKPLSPEDPEAPARLFFDAIYTTDEHGNLVRNEPMSEEEYEQWKKRLEARIIAATPSS